MKILVLICTLILVATVISFAQPPTAASADKLPKAITIKQEPSLGNLAATDHFSSIDGRFTIGLPKSISGFSALTPAILGSNASGGQFHWSLREGTVVVSYYDHLDKNFEVNTDQDFVNYFGGVKDAVLTSLKAKIVSEKQFRFGSFRGHRMSFELPNGAKGISQVLYVEKRNYTFIAGAAKEVPTAETLLGRAFDSFSLVSKTQIDADKLKSIERSTPAPLPQEPIAPKERSDAEDAGLKGKVKTVTNEAQDMSGTWSIQGRHFSSIENYNEKGNRVKRISFDSYGNPFEITVYGYLNGSRVSKDAMIRYEYAPPPMALGGGSGLPDKKTPDNRISYSYSYEYLNGKLAEMRMYYNNGTPGMRYTYTRKDNVLEKLAYDEKGKLNQKYVYKLDESGNEIEETNVDVFPSQTYGDRKYVTKYDSFDEYGNWTKKTKSKLIVENGKEILQGWYVSFRTISYF